jgi:cytochrome c
MCSSRNRALVLVLALAWTAVAAGAQAGTAATRTFGFGKPATAAEIAGWDIDVRPDGKGLPPGRGRVAPGPGV